MLICAAAGTGKTWSIKKLAHTIASELAGEVDAVPLVPLVIFVQKLVHQLRRGSPYIKSDPLKT